MGKLSKPYNIYCCIWIVYLLQDILYTSAGVLSKGLFLVIMVFNLYIMTKAISLKNNPQYIKALTVLVVIYAVYGIIRILKGSIPNVQVEEYSTLTYIKAYLLSLMPIYVFYFYSKKGEIDERWMKKWFFVFLLLVIVQYFHNETKALIERINNDEVTNNSGYYFVALLPFCLFWSKNPVIQYSIIIIASVFVISSMKRGAILVFVISLMPILYSSLKNTKGRTKLLVLVAAITSSFLLFYFVENMIATSDYFNLRIQQTMDGETSNRDLIYDMFWNTFINDYGPIEVLIGRGADATIEIGNYLAHNDWLETLMDQGLLGVFVFFYYWFSFFKMYRYSKKDSVVSIALLVLFISGLSRTFFSMSIGGIPFYNAALIGYYTAFYNCGYASGNGKIRVLNYN